MWILFILFSTHLTNVFCIVRSCTKENFENKVCETGDYQTFPIELNTVLVLREIIKINEEENSITMQMTLATFWTDLSLAASNTTKL